MSTNANPNTVTPPHMSSLNFDFVTAPLFVQNGNLENAGKGVRVKSDAVVYNSSATQEDIPVKTLGVLLESVSTGALSFHDEATFNAGFSRVLSNGHTVKLSESTPIQLLKIREAEDTVHLKDVLTLKTNAALAGGKKIFGNLKTTASNNDTVQEFQQNAAEFTGELKTTVGELGQDARAAIDTALSSETAVRLRTGAEQTLGRLKKFAWGKFTK